MEQCPGDGEGGGGGGCAFREAVSGYPRLYDPFFCQILCLHGCRRRVRSGGVFFRPALPGSGRTCDGGLWAGFLVSVSIQAVGGEHIPPAPDRVRVLESPAGVVFQVGVHERGVRHVLQVRPSVSGGNPWDPPDLFPGMAAFACQAGWRGRAKSESGGPGHNGGHSGCPVGGKRLYYNRRNKKSAFAERGLHEAGSDCPGL